MKLKLSTLLVPEVREALNEAGYEIVKVGDVPRWMELVKSLPAALYRMKSLED